MKILEATVLKTKMAKTIVARVDRKFRHARYGKVLTKHKTYKVHCEDATVKPGDFILIQETRPISKDKHFMFVKKLGADVVDPAAVVEKPAAKPRKSTVRKSPVRKPVKATKKAVKS